MIGLFKRTENGAGRLAFLLGSCIYLIVLCFFYWKYVPLVLPFQLALLPVLVAAVALTAARVELGILFFVLAFPLINGLPYLFGIYEDIPHAPTSVVLFLAFFLGAMLHSAFSGPPARVRSPLSKPLTLLFWVIVLSAVITSLRYTNFFPFLAREPLELAVNVNQVRAGGARMSVVFNSLNYISGFLFFAILIHWLKSKEYAKKLLLAWSAAAVVFLIFSMVQRFSSPSLGNTPSWIKLGRINSTFKDPNSFGVILSASLPLLLGMAMAAERRVRPFFLFLFLFGLAVFPFTGSRSGFLGLGVSLLVFFLLFLKGRKFKRREPFFYVVVLPLIGLMILVSFLIFYQKSNLSQRIESSLDFLGKESSFNELFTQKIGFWRVALTIAKEYPLSGVGMGAYIIEMPNYLKQMDLPFRHTDSAENYFFQAVSELGIIGLFLFLWVFLEISRRAKRSWRESPFQGRDRFILSGAVSGIVAIFVNYFFHSYIGSFEVKYFFWLLVALVFFSAPDKKEPPSGAENRRGLRMIPALAVVTFAFVHLWNSGHSLSIEERREKFGWAQNFGFYEQEKDDRGFRFRWARKHAGLTVDNLDRSLIVPMIASHPDVAEHPVEVKFFLSDRYFREKKPLKQVVFTDNSWMESEFVLPESPDRCFYIIFEASREWQPLKHSGVPDPRWLALATGDYWFKHPQELPEERIAEIQTLPAKNWQGRFKDKLAAAGKSFIKFKTQHKDVAVRLRVKGQKAFGLGPYIVVRLGSRIIGRAVITEEDWTSLVFKIQGEEGENVLSVEFMNDIYRPDLRQDRNVFLGDVEILDLQAKLGSR